MRMDRDFSRTGAATHQPDSERRARHTVCLIMAGLLLTTATVLAQAASQWIDFRVFDLRIRALDSGHHASVFGAASLLAQASAAAAIALRAASSPHRLRWLIVAGLVGVLLVVRTFMRHQAATTVLLLPLAALFFSLCWLTLRDPPGIRLTIWMSMFLLVCSFALHIVGHQPGGANADARDLTLAFQLTGILKHGAELAGWMLMTIGMSAAGWSMYGALEARSGSDVERKHSVA